MGRPVGSHRPISPHGWLFSEQRSGCNGKNMVSVLMGVKLISAQWWQLSLGKLPVLSTSLSSSCCVLFHQCSRCDCRCTQIMEPQILQGFFPTASLSCSWQLHGLSGKTIFSVIPWKVTLVCDMCFAFSYFTVCFHILLGASLEAHVVQHAWFTVQDLWIYVIPLNHYLWTLEVCGDVFNCTTPYPLSVFACLWT